MITITLTAVIRSQITAVAVVVIRVKINKQGGRMNKLRHS